MHQGRHYGASSVARIWKVAELHSSLTYCCLERQALYLQLSPLLVSTTLPLSSPTSGQSSMPNCRVERKARHQSAGLQHHSRTPSKLSLSYLVLSLLSPCLALAWPLALWQVPHSAQRRSGKVVTETSWQTWLESIWFWHPFFIHPKRTRTDCWAVFLLANCLTSHHLLSQAGQYSVYTSHYFFSIFAASTIDTFYLIFCTDRLGGINAWAGV